MSTTSWLGGRRRRPRSAAGTVAASAEPTRAPEGTPMATTTGGLPTGTPAFQLHAQASPGGTTIGAAPVPPGGRPITAPEDAALERWFTERIALERSQGKSTKVYEDQLAMVRGRQGARLTSELPLTSPRDIAARTGRAVAAARRARKRGASTASGRPATPGRAGY